MEGVVGIDVLFVLLSVAGVVMNIMNGTIGAAVVWGAILAYSGLNFVENVLRRSGKYD